jgi:hypothetical protein
METKLTNEHNRNIRHMTEYKNFTDQLLMRHCICQLLKLECDCYNEKIYIYIYIIDY